MDLDLTFKNGKMYGGGNDIAGKFTISGSYNNEDMKCSFIKDYLRHIINYEGCRDGKGVYGKWSVCIQGISVSGGFHIWPKGLEEEAKAELEESLDLEENLAQYHEKKGVLVRLT